MKRTKNMYYEMSEEARELVLTAENDGELFEHMISPILNNLAKHYAKGVYNADKAVDAYYRVATEASERYNKEFGYRFSVQQRFTAAVVLEEDFRDTVQERAERR